MTLQIILTLLVFFLAATVQGTTGFGFGLVVIGLLSLLSPVKHAAVMNLLPALTINAILLWRLREHLRWEHLRFIALTTALFTPVGVLGLEYLDERVMSGLLAVVLLATIVRPLISPRSVKPLHPTWLGGPMGMFAGLLAGAFGTGGPPLVAYMQSYHLPRHRHVVSIQVLVMIAGLIRAISLVWQNALTPWQWTLNGIGIIAVLPGIGLGLLLLGKISEKMLRRCVLIMLCIIMIHAAVRCVLG